MTDLDVMLKWFAPETDDNETECSLCGKKLIRSRHATNTLCEDCRRENAIMSSRRTRAKTATHLMRSGDPAIDLATAVIYNSVVDAKAGDRDAAQFLVSHDGAELWLRSVGIGITNEMRGWLKMLSIGLGGVND